VWFLFTSCMYHHRVPYRILKVLKAHSELHRRALVLHISFIHQDVFCSLLKVVHFSFSEVKVCIHFLFPISFLRLLFIVKLILIILNCLNFAFLLWSLFMNDPRITDGIGVKNIFRNEKLIAFSVIQAVCSSTRLQESHLLMIWRCKYLLFLSIPG